MSELAVGDSAVKQTIASWNDCRRELAMLSLAPFDGHVNRDQLQRLRQLSADKERLEKQLAQALPEFARGQGLDRQPHTELPRALPGGTVLIDLVQYTRIEQDPKRAGLAGLRATSSYIGFVLARGRQPRRIDLGPSVNIDEAVKESAPRWSSYA